MAREITQATFPAYPKTGSILALIGGVLVILVGALLMAASVYILPHLDYSNLQVPQGLTTSSMPGLVSGIVGVMGAFGLVSGVIVLVSSIMLMTRPSQRRTWGILILVFSVLSFIGLGGFVVGAILGMVGGVLTLRWKPPAQ